MRSGWPWKKAYHGNAATPSHASATTALAGRRRRHHQYTEQCDGECRRARQHFGTERAKPPPHGARHRDRVMLVDRVGNVEAAGDEPGADRRLAVDDKPQRAPPQEGLPAVRRRRGRGGRRLPRAIAPRPSPPAARQRPATPRTGSSAPARARAEARSHRPRDPSSSASTVHHSARPIRPSSSGSVIGVDCRYSRLGFVRMTSTAATAPAREPVKRRISCAVQ